MFETANTNRPITCPYDKSHRIAPSRIQAHIVKCEKNYPPNYKQICPYDATHRLFKFEMPGHIVSCPKRFLLEPKRHIEGKHGQINQGPPSDIASTIDCEENWNGNIENDFTSSIDESHFSNNDPANKQQEPPRLTEIEDQHDSKLRFRPPRGYAEVMYIETDDVAMEDSASVVSSMGMGRAVCKINTSVINLLGRGRGKPINNNH